MVSFNLAHCSVSYFFLGGQTTETQLFLMQFDIRMEVATMYKKGLVLNSKQEQLVATAVASQQIPDANVTLPNVSDW